MAQRFEQNNRYERNDDRSEYGGNQQRSGQSSDMRGDNSRSGGGQNWSQDNDRDDGRSRGGFGGSGEDYGAGGNDRSYSQVGSRSGAEGGWGGAWSGRSRYEDQDQARDRDRGGYGGRSDGRYANYGQGNRSGGRDEDRGFIDRAGDEVRSWFGDDDAQRRRNQDEHRGRGPKNYTRSDERIRDDVNDALSDDGMVDASDVEVSVSKGEVTLNGHVDSRMAKRRAEDCAEDVSGVKHVQNNLRVKDRSQGSTSSIGTAGQRGQTTNA